MRNRRMSVLGLGVVALAASATQAQFSENFDSYAPGSGIAGQGGWELWCTTGVDATVSTDFANSGMNSLRLVSANDVVHRFAGVTDGQWVFRTWTYVPSNAMGTGARDGYIIAMNRYCEGGAEDHDWSITVRLSVTEGIVETWENNVPNGSTLPLITDRWVEFRAEIDLDTDTFVQFYDNQALGGTLPWSTNIGVGETSIVATDIYSATLDGIYYDDVSLEAVESCAVDLNGDGAVTIADFLEFLNLFAAGDARAEFDGNPGITVGDFLAFLNAFAVGC